MAFSEISKIVAVQMFWWLAFSEILYFICVLIFSMLMYYFRNFTNQILSNIFFWHCSTKKFRISEWSQKYTHWLLFITDVNLYQHAYNRKMPQIKYLMLYINFSLFSHETNNIWWLGSLMITNLIAFLYKILNWKFLNLDQNYYYEELYYCIFMLMCMIIHMHVHICVD